MTASGIAAAAAIGVVATAFSPASSSAEGFPSPSGVAIRIAATPSPDVADPSDQATADDPTVDADPTPAAEQTPESSARKWHRRAHRVPRTSDDGTEPPTAGPSTPSPSGSPSDDAPTTTPSPDPDPVPSPAGTTASGVRDLLAQPFSSSSPWNTPLGSGATFSDDGSALTRSLVQNAAGSYINSTAYSVPISIASAGDPVQSVSVSGPAGAAHRMPADARIAQGTDASMVVLDGTRSYEYWQAARDGSGHFSAHYGTVVDLTGSGTSGGVRASGFSAAAGLIRRNETTGIDHALVVALNGSQLRSGPVWPATIQDGDAGSSYRGAVPMGSLIAIPRSVDVDSLGLSAQGRALAHALQRYGAYVGDRSSQLTLYAEPSADSSALDRMRADLRSRLAPLLRVVTNSSRSAIGGPGARIAASPAPLPGE